MKKQYIKPEIEIIQIEAEELIASSLGINEDERTVVSRSRSFWREEE